MATWQRAPSLPVRPDPGPGAYDPAASLGELLFCWFALARPTILLANGKGETQMMRKNSLSIISAGFLLLAGASATSAQVIEWTSGQVGGGWYSQAAGMAQIIQNANPDIEIRVVPGGGTANPSLVNAGRSQLGTGLDIFDFAAYRGEHNYEGQPHENLRTIGLSFSDLYFHMIRAADAEYETFEELFTEAENVDIAVTQAGSSDEQTFRYVMEYYGVDYETLRNERGWKINHLDYAASASQFGDGQVDYAFHVLGIPGAAIIEMTQARQAVIVDWPEELTSHLSETYGYTVSSLPEDTYPDAQSGEVHTIMMGTTIVANADLDADIVYAITKALCENEERLASIHQSMEVFDCATAGHDTPTPLHEGAERYYQEQGYL